MALEAVPNPLDISINHDKTDESDASISSGPKDSSKKKFESIKNVNFRKSFKGQNNKIGRPTFKYYPSNDVIINLIIKAAGIKKIK